MASLNAFALATFAALFLASTPSAQSMDVSPAVLTVGGTATIDYSNPDLAGETVDVEVENGSRTHPESTTVSIQLDEHGDGSATLVVPNWPGTTFNAPDVPEIARMILGAEKEI